MGDAVVLAALLVGRADGDDAAVGAGDRPHDEHQVVLGVDPHELEVANRDRGVAVLARHADAALRPARTSVRGVRGDTTALARAFLDTVAGPQAAEVVPDHDAGEAVALALARDIDGLHVLEHVLGEEHLADGQSFGGLGEAVFADVAGRLDVRLGQQLDAGQPPGLLALRGEVGGDVAALGAGRDAARLGPEADLDGVVAVALHVADLEQRARPELDDRYRASRAVFLEDLRHAHLYTEQTHRHETNPRGGNCLARKRSGEHHCLVSGRSRPLDRGSKLLIMEALAALSRGAARVIPTRIA